MREWHGKVGIGLGFPAPALITLGRESGFVGELRVRSRVCCPPRVQLTGSNSYLLLTQPCLPGFKFGGWFDPRTPVSSGVSAGSAWRRPAPHLLNGWALLGTKLPDGDS